jgi:hypothetical protein
LLLTCNLRGTRLTRQAETEQTTTTPTNNHHHREKLKNTELKLTKALEINSPILNNNKLLRPRTKNTKPSSAGTVCRKQHYNPPSSIIQEQGSLLPKELNTTKANGQTQIHKTASKQKCFRLDPPTP